MTSEKSDKTSLKAIDFFCGGGGMTCGFKMADINVLAGIDYDISFKETYEKNNKGTKFIHSDITEYQPIDLKNEAGIKKNDDNLIFIGCSPCQYWSIIQTDKTKSQKSKNLIHDFFRFIEYFKPGYIVVENVPGILSRKSESLLHKFNNDIEKLGYSIKYDIHDLSYYGVPQSRRRFLMIASRVSQVDLPSPEETQRLVKDYIGTEKGFPKIQAGNKDTSPFQHSCSNLIPINLKRLQKTKKNGGSRSDWKNDPQLQLKAYIGRDSDFGDNYGRMSWDKPAPTLTTRFNSISNGRFAHPEEDRGLSLREGATLQTFPINYLFFGKNQAYNAKIIGNAVPPEFAKRIANHLYTIKS